MMNNEEYSMIMRPKARIPKRKEEAKLKTLVKEQERREREPSCRLGKSAKKFAGRSAKILEIEGEVQDDKIEEENVSLIGMKAIRIKLTRSKRKPSHRDRPLEIPLFDARKDFINCNFDWYYAML